MIFPYDEGGVGLRNLKDVCMAFRLKQWWIVMTKQTLWGEFLKEKYCQRSNPVCNKWDNGESLTWKCMLQNRQQVEKHIPRNLKSGSYSFWLDKWLGIGPLAHISTHSNNFISKTVADFWYEGQ